MKCLKDMTEKAKVRVMMIHGVPPEGNKEKAQATCKEKVSSQELSWTSLAACGEDWDSDGEHLEPAVMVVFSFLAVMLKLAFLKALSAVHPQPAGKRANISEN